MYLSLSRLAHVTMYMYRSRGWIKQARGIGATSATRSTSTCVLIAPENITWGGGGGGGGGGVTGNSSYKLN